MEPLTSTSQCAEGLRESLCDHSDRSLTFSTKRHSQEGRGLYGPCLHLLGTADRFPEN